MISDKASILIVVDDMACGGRERQTVELLKGLAHSRRFRAALAVLQAGGELEAEGARLAGSFLPVRRRARFDLTPVIALLRQAQRHNIALVHAGGWISGLVGLVVARSLRVPIVNASIRATPPRLLLRHRISRWCAERSDAIVANSLAGLEAYGLSRHSRAMVIENGIDLSRFDGLMSRSGGGPTICMVANFSKKKDHATAIRAMPRIREEFPNARLLLVGRDRGTLAESSRLADALKLTSSITFVTDTSRPEHYIASSDVCVLTSNTGAHGEGVSNAILEYMALEKPVVVTNGGGSPEVIQHGATGFLVACNSPAALAGQVVQLLRAPERSRQIGQAGRRRVTEAYSLVGMVTAYETLYQRLVYQPGWPIRNPMTARSGEPGSTRRRNAYSELRDG
jgi:glycosyltransferase involved in cell wall biosynthesis